MHGTRVFDGMSLWENSASLTRSQLLFQWIAILLPMQSAMAKPFQRVKPVLYGFVGVMSFGTTFLLVYLVTINDPSEEEETAVAGSSFLAALSLLMCIGFALSGPWIAKKVMAMPSDKSRTLAKRMLLTSGLFVACFATQCALYIWSATGSDEVRWVEFEGGLTWWSGFGELRTGIFGDCGL